jgi:RNA-binding protein YlmH
VPVTTRRIALDGLRVRQPRTDRVTSVEASMRLDAVASAGFRMSRSKLLDLVRAGDIRWDAPALWLCHNIPQHFITQL